MADVLVVDDSPPLLRLIHRALTQRGHTVTEATNGVEAIAAARQRSFDIAVVDYDIPAPNGLEVIASLRELQPQCARILMSGSLDVAITTEAINNGEVAKVLCKPYTPEFLQQAVEEALARQERAAQEYLTARDEHSISQHNQLRECLRGDTLQLALQPIVSAVDGSVVAFEALMRSRHPSLDGPLSVLRAAEVHGAVAELGAVLARRAAATAAGLPEPIKLFYNLHPAELADPEGLNTRLTPLHPFSKRVVLEITERSKVTDQDGWRESIRLLTELGYEIALDDLGAGYNSLSLLAELQPQYIKLDMSIVRDIDSSSRKQRLAALLCRFADTTGATVIAEGIETEAEARTATACGAQLMQGYYFGKPQLDVDLGQWKLGVDSLDRQFLAYMLHLHHEQSHL